MGVLAYIVALLAVVSGIVLAFERMSATPQVDAIVNAASRPGQVRTPDASPGSGGSGSLTPIYPATPGKELLAARAQREAAGVAAKKPKPHHEVSVKRKPERALSARDQSATLGYAPEPPPPPPVFNRDVAY